MKILYLSTVFPKENESSTIYTDLAEELALAHQVVVMTCSERKYNQKTHISSEFGCKVIRVKTGNLYDVNYIEKGISLLILPHIFKNAIKKYVKKENFDLILYEAPPTMLYQAIKYTKKIYKAKTFLMLKDIFPQNAVDIGIVKKNSILYYIFKHSEFKLYQISDHIGCMSAENMKYVSEHNPTISDKVCYFPNTKKLSLNPSNSDQKEKLREKYSIPKGKVIFVFGGNMGKPQGIPFLCSAVKSCQDIKSAYFIFVGRGTEKKLVTEKLASVSNVLVLNNLSREEYSTLLSLCNVGIISLDYRFTIPNYPSRILSYMENSIPILAVTDPVSDIQALIKNTNCGLWNPSNSEKIFKQSVQLLLDKDLRNLLGKNGHTYFLNHFLVNKSKILLEKIVQN